MRKFLMTMAALGGCALGSTLFAEDTDLFTQLDTNKDGFITDDEVEGSKKALFERLVRVADENGDKKLSKDEFSKGTQKSTEAKPPLTGEPGRPGRPGGGAAGIKEYMTRLDKNGDGKISKDEAPERIKENFDRLDANKDGNIDAEEFARMATGFGGRPGAPGAPAGAPGRPGEPGRPGAPGGLGGPMVNLPVLRALDADGDGEISKAEIEGAAKALAALDKNGDGKLTREEILPNFTGTGIPGGPGQPGVGFRPNPEEMLRRLKEADKNGDGKISKEEAPDQMKDRFDRIDANGDGQLDEAEIKAMLERMRDAAGRRPDGGRPGAGRPEGGRPAGRPESKPEEKKPDEKKE
jgi:Ca2+-binding EF-hand superfamily protein